MAFGAEVVQRSLDAVLQNCAYAPIHAQWPECKVGNYGMSRLDGEIDTTSWYFDRDCLDENCSTFTTLSNQFPRGWIERQWYGAQFFTEPSARWIVFPEWSSGDVDSPYMYSINDHQHIGDPGEPGHQRGNLYRGGLPEELMETSLRLNRHAAESSINSFGGGHEDRLSPWVPAVYGTELGARVTEDDVRPLYMMLRGKNIRERLIFSGTNGHNPRNRSLIEAEWNATLSLIRRVDAPKLTAFSRVEGAKPVGSPTDSVGQLEYTLRVGPANREVGLASVNFAGTTSLKVSIDEVKPTSEHPGVKVYIESRLSEDPGEVNGRLFALDLLTNDWVAVPRRGLNGPETYDFFTDDQAAREWFYLYTTMFSQSEDYDFIDEAKNHRLTLLLVMKFDEPWATSNEIHDPIVSYYDLVQAVTVMRETEGDPGPGFAMQSDLDHDGAATDGDLVMFVDRWSCQCAAADMDLDDDVDGDDLTEFVGHYLEEQD